MKIKFGFGLMAAALVLTFGCKDPAPESSCVYGNDIPPEKMDPILDLTNMLSMMVVQGDYKQLYDYGSSDLKNAQTRDQFVFALDIFNKAFGAVDYPQATELYYLTSKAKDPQIQITCNLGQPGVNDVYTMPANRVMAVAVYDARTEMEPIRMVFQLEKEGDLWKLRSLQLNPKTMKKQTADYYHAQAIKFREENRLHLAVIYLKTAILLHDLGFNVSEFTALAIQQQMNQIKVDYMPMGEIQMWEITPQKSFKVYNLDSAYDNGSLLLQISYMAEDLSDHDRLEADARALALFLDQKFPEYRLGFDGIRVTAASESPQELLMSYHSLYTFSQLDELRKGTPPLTDEGKEGPKTPEPTTPKPDPAPDTQPSPGTTAAAPGSAAEPAPKTGP